MAQGGKTLVFVHKTSLIKCLIKGHNAQWELWISEIIKLLELTYLWNSNFGSVCVKKQTSAQQFLTIKISSCNQNRLVFWAK